MLRDLISYSNNVTQSKMRLEEFEQASGVRMEDLASAVGGEVTFALDGPMIPTPSWKLILEVKDAARVQDAIAKLIQAANAKLTSAGEPAIQTATVPPPNPGAPEIHTLRFAGSRLTEVHYAFTDGYVVFGASDALLQRAISDRRSGVTLARSREFRNLLPGDSRSNVSGLFYQNAGDLIRLMAQGAGSVAGTAEQQKAAEEIAQKVEPMLLAIYGEDDRIELASQGSALNLLTQTMAGHLFSANRPADRTRRELRAYR